MQVIIVACHHHYDNHHIRVMRSSICCLFIGSNLKDLWGDNNFNSWGNSCSDLHKQTLPSLWYVSSIHLSSSSSDGPYTYMPLQHCYHSHDNSHQKKQHSNCCSVLLCSKWSRCSNCYEYFDITGLTVASKSPVLTSNLDHSAECNPVPNSDYQVIHLIPGSFDFDF